MTSTVAGEVGSKVGRRRARQLWDRSLHRVLYTLLFGFVAVAMATLVVPPMRRYSGANEQIIALTVVMILVVELTSARLHRLVDWLLYGQRHDPAAASARLARPLSDSEEEHTLEALLAALAETLRLTHVSVAVHEDARLIEVGAYDGGRPVTFPIRRAGRSLGELRASRRGQPLDRSDDRLLEAAAAQVGLVLHARALTEEIRTAREELVVGVEEERRRLRREIHDGIGPALAGIGLGVESATRAVDDDPARARSLLTDVSSDVTNLVSEVRQVAHGLRPALLDELGLADALRSVARSFETRSGCSVDVETRVPTLVPAAVEVAAYRIATEALTNVARHAGATHVRLCAAAAGDELVVSLEDDGRGGASERPDGTGLTSMRLRAAEVGGTFDVTSSPAGTTVTARLPLAPGQA